MLKPTTPSTTAVQKRKVPYLFVQGRYKNTSQPPRRHFLPSTITPARSRISPGKVSDRQVPPPPPIPEGPPLSVGRRPGPSRLAEPSGPPARAEGGLGRNAGGGGSISKCLGACQARSGRG